MSTASTTRHITELATRATAKQIAATVAKQAAAQANVDIRYMGPEDAVARAVVRSTETESHPYSSFEQGGIRRFERLPFARGPFERSGNLPPFRVS